MVNSSRSAHQSYLKTKTTLAIRPTIGTEPLVMLYAKPHCVVVER